MLKINRNAFWSGVEVCEPYEELTNGKISKNFVLAGVNM